MGTTRQASLIRRQLGEAIALLEQHWPAMTAQQARALQLILAKLGQP